MTLKYDEVFKINSKAMKYSISYPDRHHNITCYFKFFIFHGVFLTYIPIITYSAKQNLKSNDFSKTAQDGTFIVIWLLASFQYFIMTWKKESLAELIRLINKDYQEMIHLPKEEQDIVMLYVNKGVYVCKQCLVLATYASGFYVLKNMYFYIRNYCNGVIVFVPFYDFSLPRFMDEYKGTVPYYIGSYYLTLNYSVYTTLMYIAFVPLGSIFMLHACGQLEMITRRMEKLFVDKNEEKVMVELKDIIVKMQNIYRFVDIVKDCFRLANELTLKTTTFLLPITFYEVVGSFGRGRVSIEFITFICGSILISSYPCYYSELLMEKGERFRLAVYTCGWERHYYRRTRSTIVLLQQRALRPVAMETMFRNVCLDALADLFHSAYAIFSLMNAMWD